MSTREERSAWRRLPRTERENIRRDAAAGRAAATPELRQTAYAWATRPSARWPRIVVGLVFFLGVTGAIVTAYTFGDSADYWQLLFWSATLPIVVGLTLSDKFDGAAAEVASANAMGLLADTAVGQPADLEVQAKSARPDRIIEAAFLLPAVAGVVLGPPNHRLTGDLRIVAWCLAGLIAGLVLGRIAFPGLLSRRPRRGQPVLELDEDGVTVPWLGVYVPWSDVTAVRTRPIAHERDPTLGVAFTFKDPAAVLAAARPRGLGRRRQLRKMLAKENGLTVPASWLDQPLLTVLTTARDYLATSQAANV